MGEKGRCSGDKKNGPLFQKIAILLLQPANLVHVDRVETILGFLLVSRELFLLHRLQAYGSVVADADDQNLPALALAF